MKRIGSILLVGMVSALPSFADDPKPLDRVPKDAALFAHLRTEAILETSMIQDFLKPLSPRLQNDLLKPKELEKMFGMNFRDIESLTLVLPRFAQEDPFESGFAVVVTKKTLDKEKLKKQLERKIDIEKNPKGQQIDPAAPPLKNQEPAQRSCQFGEPKKLPANVLPLDWGWNMVFLGEREFILVSDFAVESVLNMKSKETGPHLGSLKKAATKDYLGVLGYHPAAGVEESIPEPELARLKPYLGALLPAHAEITLTLKKGIELEGTWSYSSEDKAKEGQQALEKVADLLQKEIDAELESPNPSFLVNLFGQNFRTQLKAMKPKIDGKNVRLSFNMPIENPSELGKKVAQQAEELLPRIESQNNLKQMMLALHNHESAFGNLPSAAICDKEGKPLLSWRVAILPYIEQEKLYEQFKLDEPWDSKNNKPLIAKMPKIFAHPSSEDKQGHTRYRIFVGKQATLDYNRKTGLLQITDGTSNTGAIFESADAVIWTKPDEMDFDMKKTTTKSLYFDKNQKTAVAMFDGSVQLIDKKYLDKCLGILVCPSDGEILPDFREGSRDRRGNDNEIPKNPAPALPPPPAIPLPKE